MAISTKRELAFPAASASGFGLVGMGAGFVITAELIMVLLAIEANTRRMRGRSFSQQSPSAGEQIKTRRIVELPPQADQLNQ
jgi:hypothetical protein